MVKNTSLSLSDDLWLAKPVPRYTSYPPAPVFRAGEWGDAYARELGSFTQDQVISLYVHIPFCRHLCLYCGCHTSVTNKDERMKAYLDALAAEMQSISQVLGRRQKVSHLHFGGGSPNALSRELMHDLFTTLGRNFDFSTCDESAMELDPRLASREQLEILADHGITRISLGVQDFNASVQEAIGRVQPYAQVEKVCNWARAAGIRAINFDLMYGLPLQSEETIEQAARLALELAPDRVSFFSYAHVPSIKSHQKALEAFPMADKYGLLKQEAAGRAVWEASGYCAIGMDHFARDDDTLSVAARARRLHRNFQGYTDDTAQVLLGLGASSIGQTTSHFYQNIRDVDAYEKTVLEGKLATMRCLAMTAEDHLRSAVIEELMCYMGADLGEITARLGTTSDHFNAEKEALKPFAEAGIIEITGDRIQLTTPRRQAIRVIASLFDQYAGVYTASKAA